MNEGKTNEEAEKEYDMERNAKKVAEDAEQFRRQKDGDIFKKLFPSIINEQPEIIHSLLKCDNVLATKMWQIMMEVEEDSNAEKRNLEGMTSGSLIGDDF